MQRRTEATQLLSTAPLRSTVAALVDLLGESSQSPGDTEQDHWTKLSEGGEEGPCG